MTPLNFLSHSLSIPEMEFIFKVVPEPPYSLVHHMVIPNSPRRTRVGLVGAGEREGGRERETCTPFLHTWYPPPPLT